MTAIKMMTCVSIVAAICLVTGCETVPVQPIHVPPPMADIVPRIKPGMTTDEVTRVMDGNTPDLLFTSSDKRYSLWEFQQRDGMQAHNKTITLDEKGRRKVSRPDELDRMGYPIGKGNTIESRRTRILFDAGGKVTNVLTSTCQLPDSEIKDGSAPKTACYQKREFPFEKQVTYDAIKLFLIVSNFQIAHSDSGSEIISADGIQPSNVGKGKTMFIKLSIIFSEKKPNLTEVAMSATFSIAEKQQGAAQVGMAGVTLPIPNPFQKRERWIGSGIATPLFYENFFDSLSYLMATEFLVYQPPAVVNVANGIPGRASPAVALAGKPTVKAAAVPVASDTVAALPTTSGPGQDVAPSPSIASSTGVPASAAGENSTTQRLRSAIYRMTHRVSGTAR